MERVCGAIYPCRRQEWQQTRGWRPRPNSETEFSISILPPAAPPTSLQRRFQSSGELAVRETIWLHYIGRDCHLQSRTPDNYRALSPTESCHPGMARCARRGHLAHPASAAASLTPRAAHRAGPHAPGILLRGGKQAGLRSRIRLVSKSSVQFRLFSSLVTIVESSHGGTSRTVGMAPGRRPLTPLLATKNENPVGM